MPNNSPHVRSSKLSIEPLWGSAEVVEFLGICPRKFAYMRAQGEMVLPVAKIGRSLRFAPDEVRAWVQAGCPPTNEWNAMKVRDG